MSIETVVKIQSEIIDKLISHVLKSNSVPTHLTEEKQEILDLQRELQEALEAL
jgi:hypothetical protein